MAVVRELQSSFGDELGTFGELWITFDDVSLALDEIEIISETRRPIRYVIVLTTDEVWEDAVIPPRPNPQVRSVKPKLNRPQNPLTSLTEIKFVMFTSG